ncbi:CDP-diacylglycerol--serine O-phosphatidyltransferase [Pollutimonas bauzanensis]|uniref:CDP-diacylglycerol--serine O-phosphatidyltransferase n=1 Tax=Pollutimonas bauzanensis TaxID=658167 RepID=A0A1M5YY34_9BURK|nr:CDP-diacylglycerol--serine O-phosphatidyltransferase [Pollutimonas bauzanensis]SHI16927.1 CDP-diacylglycerol---serine O-phosphatidyltransferase [Pollutimonas bauzanensis]
MPNFSSDETRRRRSIYLLPNAFTTANLFAGFYAVVQAMNGRFEMAAIAIFLAMVFDGMDGRVARLTNTQSAFGEQYDSLSDMTSFGIAPALVMYEWSLQGLGRWGWLAAFIYVVGAALRLARFNTNIGVVDKRFFQGLPSPAAAALVAGFLWLAVDNKLSLQNETIAWLSFGFTVYAGIAMVTNAPFYSGKSFALGRSVPFWVILVLVGVFVFVSSDPPIVLFGLFVVYGLSGWVIMLWRWRRARELTRLRQEGLEERDATVTPTFTASHTYQPPQPGGQQPGSQQSGDLRQGSQPSPPEKPRGPL